MTPRRAPINDQPNPITGNTREHHGDLRKGIFLQRRNAYQLQAQSTPGVQAGLVDASTFPPKTGVEPG